jgi:mycothiol synthase
MATMDTPLAGGYALRAPRPDEAADVCALACAVDVAQYGAPDTNEEDIRPDWARPRFHLDRDAWLVEAPDGGLVAYAWLWERTPDVEFAGYIAVHPDHAGRGLEEALLEAVEARGAAARTAAPPAAAPVVRLFVAGADDAQAQLLTAAGYTVQRRYFRMGITLTEQPRAPAWPAGVIGRAYRGDEDAAAVHAAVDEAFHDHFNHHPEPLDE